MSGFSPEWLALREPVDHRSRNRDVAQSLTASFAGRPEVSVVDLGSGTGSNLRATFDLLPSQQHWTLVDHDAALLETAKRQLASWADRHEASGEDAVLHKSGRRITVSFRVADLSSGLDGVLDDAPDLVTASALFDLVSVEFIRTLSDAVAQRKATFYTVLTYNGVLRWSPAQPIDDAIKNAFNKHQMSNKGFGVAAGQSAPRHLAAEFQHRGYGVEEGNSPWELECGDAKLIEQLAVGVAAAVAETGALDSEALEKWLKSPRTSAYVGHVDTLARPL